MLLTIKGRLPSLNDYIRAERAGWQAANAMKRSNQDIIIAAVRASKLEPVKCPVSLNYRFYEKDTRRDKDNVAAVAHKFVQDALVEAGILPGDGWDQVTGFSDTFFVDAKEPRIVIEIKEET